MTGLDLSEIHNHATFALRLALIASLPPVVAAATTGVIISLIQALTQIQEQTLAFGFKLMAVSLTLYATLELVTGGFYAFTARLLRDAARVSAG